MKLHEASSSSDLAAACASAEESFQRGQVGSRELAEAVLSAACGCGLGEIQASALQLLGEIDYDELAYGASLQRLNAAIALREKLLGPCDDLIRYSLACRAVVLVAEDRHEEAAEDVKRASSGRTAPTSLDDAAENARLWVALSAALSSLARQQEARSLLEAVVASEATGKLLPLSTANACLHLASLLEEGEPSERTLQIQQKTVDVRRQVIGEPSLRVALALSTLATSRMRAGQAEQGRALMQESLAMLEACGHASHPRASVVYLGLAIAEVISDHGAASERWLSRAIELETRTFGPLHPCTGSMLLTAANSFAGRGHHGRAAELAQRAAAAFFTRLPTRSAMLESAIGQGFMSLRHLKRYDAIIKWLEPLIAKFDRIQPPPEHVLAPTLNMLGEGYLGAGKLAKAEAVIRRAMPMAVRLHGEESRPMHVLLVNLAQLLTRQRRLSEAYDVEERAQRLAEVLEERSLTTFQPRWRRGSA